MKITVIHGQGHKGITYKMTSTVLEFLAEDNDEIYYDEDKNEIVFVSSDGYIRTYFKPSEGINYYNRQ